MRKELRIVPFDGLDYNSDNMIHEMTPQQIEAIRVSDAFKRITDPTPLVRNPAVFELFSHVPGIRITDNADMKMRIADTMQPDGMVVAFRLDPEGQDDFQLYAWAHDGQEPALVFQFEQRNGRKLSHSAVYSLFFDPESGNRTKTLIVHPKQDGSYTEYVQTNAYVARCNVSGLWQYTQPLVDAELAGMMGQMLHGEMPAFPERMH